MHPAEGRRETESPAIRNAHCLAWPAEERYSRKHLGHDSTEMLKAQAKG